MDLGGWNFDPSLLNSLTWNDNSTDHTSNNGENNSKKNTTESKAESSTRSSPARLDSNNWVGNLALLSNFGVLDYEGAGSSQRSKSSDTDRDVDNLRPSSPLHGSGNDGTSQRESTEGTHTISAAQSVSSGNKDGGISSVASRGVSSTSTMPPSAGGPQLHPLAIQSSATCPPHGSTNGTGDSTSGVQANPYLHLASTGMTLALGQNHHESSDFFGLHGIDSAALASLAAAFQNPSTHNINHNNHQSNNHISSLAANFMLAQAASTDTNHSVNNSNPPQHLQHASTTNSHTHSGIPATAPSTTASRTQQSRQQNKQNKATSKPPPFYLFDAPIELRANFVQNQRKLGLPIQHDPNSYHYGETVKGFHPQSLMNQQQVNAMSDNDHVNQIPEAPIQLIDARHGNLRSTFSGRVKNEREQKRAQKITELIDQLRIDMERGGCKVEVRSKFHTLSQ